jgi:methylmalonyl-CoA/ethylmalonyl-CoA epimerase
MEEQARQRLAHICILVRDIDQAIEHYTRILGVVSPSLLNQKIVQEECFAGKDHYLTTFFRAPDVGCDIQLLQPLDSGSPLFNRLEKQGEGLHHIAFASTHLEDTFQRLKQREVTLHGDQFNYDVNNPDSRWVWITPQYAHGVLIEVMDEYKKIDRTE